MMEDAQRRVQDGVNTVMSNIDKPLRKLQGSTHRCAAACCDDVGKSMAAVQECVSRCEAPAMSAHESFQHEMQNFQERLTRCAQTCQDSILDKAGPDMSEAQRDKLQKQMEICSLKCADDHVKLLPKIEAKLISNIESKTKK